MNECQKAICNLVKPKMILEMKSIDAKKVIAEAAEVKSPADIKKFIDKNDEKIKMTSSKMKGKEKSFFLKAYDFISYASKKGLKFISDHWFDIVKLIGIILLGMFSYRLYSLAMPQIEKLFTFGRQNEIKAAKNASRNLDSDGEALQNAVNNITSAVDKQNDNTHIYKDKSSIDMKQRIINKTIDDYRFGQQDKDLKSALNRVASEIRKDPIAVRKRSTGSGNLTMMR